jgi:transcriptional regulator with XRE-family HTH domain
MSASMQPSLATLHISGQEELHPTVQAIYTVLHMDGFGARLRAAIDAAHMTQSQLAEQVGRSKGAVTQWVHGQTEPDLRTLAEICKRLNVSADYLVRGVNATPYLDEQVVAIANRVQCLEPSAREGLHELIFGKSVPDHVVEARMPITKVPARQRKK